MTQSIDFEELALAGWRFWLESGRIRYRAPRNQLDDKVLATLRDRREELLEILSTDPTRLAISPLSYGQRAIWFLAQIDPESTAYNQSLLLYPEPGSSASVWRSRCQRLLERHSMLRATFSMREGLPIQRFPSDTALAWSEVDATGSAAEVTHTLAHLQLQPFNLSEGPIVRFCWIVGPTRPILALLIHHIACDGWSLQIIRSELYTEFKERDDATNHDAPRPVTEYRDFVFWQREFLATQRGTELWRFWSAKLNPPIGPMPLPYDRSLTSSIAGPNEMVIGKIEGPLLAALRRLAVDLGVTPSALALATFFTLLHRWTGQTDLAVGMPSSGRDRIEWQHIVGYFVDPVVIRVDAEPQAAFDAFARTVASRSLEAIEHRDLPFAHLAERLQGQERTPGRSIFNVLFNFLPEAYDEKHPIEIPTKHAKFDLTLTVYDGSANLALVFGYRADLFAPSTIEPFPGALRAMIGALSKQPTLRLESIPLVEGRTPPQPVLVGDPTPTADLPLVHNAVASHARTYPSRVALCDWASGSPPCIARRIDYRSLQEEVEQIAAYLRTNRVADGARVALVSRYSGRFVAALLAIWSFGGAAIIIDDALPESLAAEMVSDAAADALITYRDAALSTSLVDIPSWTVEQALEASVQAGGQLSGPGTIDDLAYIVFTSGSTGRPKGVRISHRSLANYIASARVHFCVDEGGSFGVLSPLSADLGYTMVFLALATAGTLHVIPPAVSTSPGAVAACIAQGLDYLKITPSHLGALSTERGLPLPKKALILGGEATSTGWAREILARAQCRIFNHYGPTETTIGVATHELVADRDLEGSTLPLSRSVFNSQLFILDRSRQPVPRGMPGLLFVAGAPLAQGYVNDENGAAAFEEVPRLGRTYCTGDLVRQRGQDLIEFLGRADRQLKVNGYRVEPAQVERTIMDFEGIKQSLVVGEVEGGRTSRLVGWVTINNGEEPARLLPALHNYLKARLPSYMVPARIGVRDHLDITKTGKVDTDKMLLSMDSARAPTPLARTMNDIELRLVLLFRELLGCEGVSVNDSFFDLGGHSILALRLSARIFDEFGCELPLRTLFMNSSPRELAALIDNQERTSLREDRHTLIRLRTGNSGMPVVLLPGAGGSLLYFEDLASRLQNRYVIGVPPTRASIEQAAAFYHRTLVDTFGDQPYHLIGHSFGALVAYELGRRIAGAGCSSGRIILLDNRAPNLRPDLSHRVLNDADWCAHIARRIQQLYNVELAFEHSALASLSESDLRAQFAELLIQSGIFPSDITVDQIWGLVETYRDNVVAANTYCVQGTIPGIDLHVVRAQDNEDGALPRSERMDPFLGWRSATRGHVDVSQVPGTHITMLFQPQVDNLAACINTIIASKEA